MPAGLHYPRALWRKARRAASYVLCVADMHRRWSFGVRQRGHELPRPLVVSLTSYPPRFPTLDKTLKCLLRQTVKPDAIVLWLAPADRAKLPVSVSRLKPAGVTIEFCDDIRSYKKLVPALERFPGAVLVTVDDDLYLPRTWLEELTSAYDPLRTEVVCHRMHRVVTGTGGLPLPYLQWQLNDDTAGAHLANFPTGGAGALFPPGAFYTDVTRDDIFTALCPDADDLWAYWMLLLNRTPTRRAGPRRDLITWRGSQSVSLFRTNVYRNDVQIHNLIARYGFPLAHAARTPVVV